MKKLMFTLLGVLLLAISATALSRMLISSANARMSGTRAKIVGAPTASTRIKSAWRLGTPVRHENLTVFPVISDEAVSTDEFITLDAGLRSSKVKVTEMVSKPSTSSSSRSLQQSNQRPNQAVQQRTDYQGDGAEVNKVLVTNRSGKTLVLIAGEMILGGKQDRIVGHDCIVASTGEAVPIDVYCVEHGRWQADSRQRSGVRDGASSGAGSSESAGAAPPEFASADEVMAAPKVRANAQANKSQSGVWSEVAENVSKNHVSTSTGTLNSVFDNRQVNARLKAFQNAIKARFTDKTIIGAVVAINGKVVSADVFASPQLFQAYQAKLLKSYALEAISADKTKAKEVTAKDAEAFLSRADGAEATVEQDGIYRLKEKQSADDASFELEHTAKSGKLIHFNRVLKK